MGKFKNDELIAKKEENERLKNDNLLLGMQVSDLEIGNMELGMASSALEIGNMELEGGTINV